MTVSNNGEVLLYLYIEIPLPDGELSEVSRIAWLPLDGVGSILVHPIICTTSDSGERDIILRNNSTDVSVLHQI